MDNVMEHPRIIAILDILDDRLNEDIEYFETILNDIEDIL